MKGFFKWGVGLFLVLSIVVLVGYLLVVYGVIRLNYPSRIIYPIQGIDVSHHQGDVDWNKVKGENWDFVIMKATEGGDWKDSKFSNYYQEANDAGFVVGVYHYYSFCSDPVKQAKHFIDVAGDLKGDLLPAVDLEFDNNCNGNISVEDFKEAFVLFLNEIRVKYGCYPIVYCNEAFYFKYLNKADFANCKFWIRNVGSQPDLNERMWDFWQYSALGSVAGIQGPVDLNAFSGRRFEFEELIMD